AGRDGMEEERRLCYVAMTRAKRKLFMTSNSGYSYVTDSRTAPSKFFEEAGIKLPNPRPTLPSQSGYANKNWDGSTRSWGQKKVYGEENYFSDGDAISPFEKKPEPKQEERPADNGITHWGIGDGAHHEKFGDGIVTKIIDKTIIVVNFDGVGEKTLLSTHPMLSKRFSKGGQA
ncbi:MAG: hypothetical protein HUJ60_06670, partial [Bacilli bacterium]|nr:hypothetical protein [Bacilli bacterium]